MRICTTRGRLRLLVEPTFRVTSGKRFRGTVARQKHLERTEIDVRSPIGPEERFRGTTWPAPSLEIRSFGMLSATHHLVGKDLAVKELRSPMLQTERLVLRRWRADDLAPFAALNADPVVMEHFQQPLTRAESDAFVERIEAEFDDCGFGLWAVEVRGEAPFIGYVGLHRVPFEAPFTPAVEVGWRLAREHWGNGYAAESARVAVRYGFDEAGLDEIVSFTSLGNERSWRVMERIGMVRDPNGDFDHPNVPVGHRLRRHVLYRIPPR